MYTTEGEATSTRNQMSEIVEPTLVRKPMQIYSKVVQNLRASEGQALGQELLHCPFSLKPGVYCFISPDAKYFINLLSQVHQAMECSSEKILCGTRCSKNTSVER